MEVKELGCLGSIGVVVCMRYYGIDELIRYIFDIIRVFVKYL